MPQVSLRINSRTFDMSCADGEETHLEALAAEINRRIEQLRPQMPGAAEIKLLLAAALTLADEVHDLRHAEPVAAPRRRDQASAPDPADKLATVFEQLVTARVDTIAAKLSAA